MARALAPGNQDAVPSTTEDEFLALVLADDDLVRAEFDAIIAAEWPGQPASRPGRETLGDPDPRHRARPQPAADRLHRPRSGHSDQWARQRSPPRPTRSPATT